MQDLSVMQFILYVCIVLKSMFRLTYLRRFSSYRNTHIDDSLCMGELILNTDIGIDHWHMVQRTHLGSFLLIYFKRSYSTNPGFFTAEPLGITPFLIASFIIWIEFILFIAAAPITLSSDFLM